MPVSTPDPRVRGAFEAVLRLAGPGLDLLVAAGDRLSRVLERRDDGYAIVRMEHEGRSAPRSLDAYAPRSEAT